MLSLVFIYENQMLVRSFQGGKLFTAILGRLVSTLHPLPSVARDSPL